MGCVSSSEAEPRSEVRNPPGDPRRGKQGNYVIKTKADFCSLVSIDMTCHVGRAASGTPSPRPSSTQRSVGVQVSRGYPSMQIATTAAAKAAASAAAASDSQSTNSKGMSVERTSLLPRQTTATSLPPVPLLSQPQVAPSPQPARDLSSPSVSSMYPPSPPTSDYPVPASPHASKASALFSPSNSRLLPPRLSPRSPLAQPRPTSYPALTPPSRPFVMAATASPRQVMVPSRPPLYRLPPELWSRVTTHLDKDSWDSLRLCSKETRAAIDATVTRLRVVYGSVVPTLRAPGGAAAVERALQGLLSRGCRPQSLRLNLSDLHPCDPERGEKGRVVLAAMAQLTSLEKLTISGLHFSPLDGRLMRPSPNLQQRTPGMATTTTPAAAAAAVAATSAAAAAVCHVSRLRLAGCSTSDVSLLPGLKVLLPAAARLSELELCNLDITSLAIADVEGLVHPVWGPLWEATKLTRLVLNFRDGGSGVGGASSAGGDGPFGAAAAGALSLAYGIAGMTQLQALGLGLWRDDCGSLLAAALPVVAGALTRLHCLELRIDSPPPHLLSCLESAMTRLQTLSLYCEQRNGGLQDLHLLRQLTALTSLTLVNALPPSGLATACSAGSGGINSSISNRGFGGVGGVGSGSSAGGEEGSDGKLASSLPPALQVLRLNRPLSVGQLAALAVPSTLTCVSFGGTAEPMLLPDTDTDRWEWYNQVAAAAAKLAAWGVQDLALRAPPQPPLPSAPAWPSQLTLTAAGLEVPYADPHESLLIHHHHHTTPYHRGIWLRSLAPLKLCNLRLYDVELDAAGARALAAAVGSSLEELTIDGAGASLLRVLPGVACMPRLKVLTVCGAACEGMSRVETGDRQKADAAAAGASTTTAGAVCVCGTSRPYALPPARQLQTRQGGQQPQPPPQPQQPQERLNAGAPTAGCLEGDYEEELEGPVGDWSASLMAALARGVHVRLFHNVLDDVRQRCHYTLPMSYRIGGGGGGGISDTMASVAAAEALAATLNSISSLGQCRGWGKFEIHLTHGSNSSIRRWGQLSWNDVA